MAKQKNKIENFLKKVRGRLFGQQFIENLLQFLSIGLGVSLGISVFSMFVPWYYATVAITILMGLTVVLNVWWSLKRRPTLEQTALRVDALGYEEKIVTAYQEWETDSLFANIQRKDAERILSEINIRKSFPIRIRFRRWGIFLLMAALFAGSMLIDTDARTRAGYQHRVQEKAKQEIAEIEKVEKKVQDKKEISEQEAADILKELEDTKKALEDAENYQEIQKAAERGWLKLSDAAHSGNQALNQTLSEAVEQKQEQKNKNLEQLIKETQDALNQAENGTSAEKEYAAEKMEELAAALGNSELSTSAEAYSQSEKNAMDAAIAKKAIEQVLASQMASGNNTSGNGNSGSSEANPNSSGNQSNSENNQNSNGNQNGSGNGQNSNGNQNGSGNGTGTGWNKGSKNGAEGENKTAEAVTIPDGDVGTDENLTGKGTGGGQNTYEKSDQSLTWSGNKVSYGQVSGEYKEKAYRSLETSTYPDSMKDKIKTYFDGLN